MKPLHVMAGLLILAGCSASEEIGTGIAELSLRGPGKGYLRGPAIESCKSSGDGDRYLITIPAESGRTFLTIESVRRLTSPSNYAATATSIDSQSVRATFGFPASRGQSKVDSGTVVTHRTAVGDVIDIHLFLSQDTTSTTAPLQLQGAIYKLRRTPGWLVQCGPS